jgi:hypothetical protein
MKPAHYFAHWDIWEDFCVYCGKRDRHNNFQKYGVICSCFRFDSPHGIRRRICFSCIKKIRKEVENSGFTSTYLLNMIENRMSHGEVQWQ